MQKIGSILKIKSKGSFFIFNLKESDHCERIIDIERKDQDPLNFNNINSIERRMSDVLNMEMNGYDRFVPLVNQRIFLN